MAGGSANQDDSGYSRPPTTKECVEFDSAFRKWYKKRYGRNYNERWPVRGKENREEKGGDETPR